MNGIVAFSEPDQDRLEALVVACELGAELADAGGELAGGEKDVPDAGIVEARFAQDAFCRPNRAASRSKSRS